MVCTHSQRSAVSGYVRRRTGRGVGREHDHSVLSAPSVTGGSGEGEQ